MCQSFIITNDSLSSSKSVYRHDQEELFDEKKQEGKSRDTFLKGTGRWNVRGNQNAINQQKFLKGIVQQDLTGVKTSSNDL
jgi:hypothetical protein